MLTYFLSTCLYLQIGTEIKNVLKMWTQKNNILDDIGWYEINFCLVKNNRSKLLKLSQKQPLRYIVIWKTPSVSAVFGNYEILLSCISCMILSKTLNSYEYILNKYLKYDDFLTR